MPRSFATGTGLGRLLRRLGIDCRRMGPSGLTFRLMEHDLPRLVASRSPVVFDVGANKGQTIELIREAFPGSKIYAFEPSVELADRLRERFAPSGVVIEGIALGAREERRRFINYENNELSSFLPLSGAASNPFVDVAIRSTGEVAVTTVDGYCDRKGIERIDLLKVDTQGFDLEVLRGADRMVGNGRVGAILVEVNFTALYENQCAPGEIIDWLGARSFSPVAFYDTFRRGEAIAWATVCFIGTRG